MKKTAAIAALAVAAAVTGCSPGLTDTDVMYLENVRDRLAQTPDSVMAAASDADLIAAAREACVQLDANGGDPTAVQVVDNEALYQGRHFIESQRIAVRATIYYCEQHVNALDVATLS